MRLIPRGRHLLLALPAAALLLPANALAQGSAPTKGSTAPIQVFKADLAPVGNNPPAEGKATLVRKGEELRVVLTTRGVSPDLPHAMHIHGDLQAANECPGPEAAGADGLIDTLDGLPAYGPIQVTFTTSGNSAGGLGPDALDLSRAPVANRGGIVHYNREIDLNGPGIDGAVDEKLEDLHIVVHGEDLNGNGEYDFVPGTSSLSPLVGANVPLEAELPVACGPISAVGR